MIKKIIIILIILALVTISFLQLPIVGFILKADYRPRYCEGEYCMSKIIFSELPSYPKDFSDTVSIDTPEEFYKQPEFYPNWKDQGLPYYKKPPGNYLGFYGFGAYPSEAYVISRDNNKVTEVTFFHTSWYVINYQGIELYLRNESLRNYFDVNIEPNIIVLDQTFPKFDYNWTQKIKIIITPKDPPKGKYVFEIDAKEPPREYSEKWSEKYGIRYSDAGMFSIGKPFYELVIDIK